MAREREKYKNVEEKREKEEKRAAKGAAKEKEY